MARAARLRPERQLEPPSAWHQLRQVVAILLFAVVAGLMLYGAWLALAMHLTKTMPAASIGRFLLCAVLAAAIFTVCVRIEPLPVRRKRRGKRWINVETPTQRQIWETAPGDFVESVFAAVGMMATPTMMLIGVGLFVAYEDFPDLMIATAVAAGAFAIEGAFVSWRGRSMFDPPGRVRAAEEEPKSAVDGEKPADIGSPEPDGDRDSATADGG